MSESLSYAVRLDSSGFASGLRYAQKSLSAFRIGLANALVSKGFSLLQQAASRFASTLRSSLDLGSELTHLSAETGATVSQLLVLRQTFQDCGVPAGSLSTSLVMMQKALSGISETGQRTEGVFAALGLDIGELRKMSPSDAFQAIGSAIGSLGSAADRTAASVAIFGRSGAALNRVFSNPDAIRQARDSLGSMPSIMALNASRAEAWQTSMGRLQTQIQGGVMGALSAIAPVLEDISGKVASIDFGEIGLNIGAYLKQIWEGGLTGLFNQLAARCNIIGVAVWEAVKMAFAPLFEAGTWKSLGLLVGGALLEAAGMLSKAFTACIALLTAGIEKAIDYLKEGLNYIPGLNLETSGKTFGQHYDDAMKAGSWTYQPALDMASDLMDRGMAGVADAWPGAFDGWGDAVMDSAGAQYLEALAQEREAWKELQLQQGKLAEKTQETAQVFSSGLENGLNKNNAAVQPMAKPVVDQWAKIGAFAGNGANKALEEVSKRHLGVSQKHLTLAEKTNARIQQLVTQVSKLEAATT